MVALGSSLAIPSPPQWLASEKTAVGYPPRSSSFSSSLARQLASVERAMTGSYFVATA
jgi:hypothetical protein